MTPMPDADVIYLDYNASTIPTILPLLDGGLRSSANDINEYNQVVGSSEILVNGSIEKHAFVWSQANGITVDLNSWAANGWVFTDATAINDNGDIVGKGEFVLVISGAGPRDESAIDSDRLLALLDEKLGAKEASRLAAEITGEKKNALYERLLELREKSAT